MDIIYDAVKLFLMSIFGYYLLGIFDKNSKTNVKGIVSPFYFLFSILSIYACKNEILYLFLMGILWAQIVNIYFKSTIEKLSININIIFFGIFNILNCLVLNPIIDTFLYRSNIKSIMILFIITVLFLIFDLGNSLRKNTSN